MAVEPSELKHWYRDGIGQNLGLPVTSHFEDAINYATASVEYETKPFEMRVRHALGPRFR